MGLLANRDLTWTNINQNFNSDFISGLFYFRDSGKRMAQFQRVTALVNQAGCLTSKLSWRCTQRGLRTTTLFRQEAAPEVIFKCMYKKEII